MVHRRSGLFSMHHAVMTESESVTHRMVPICAYTTYDYCTYIGLYIYTTIGLCIQTGVNRLNWAPTTRNEIIITRSNSESRVLQNKKIYALLRSKIIKYLCARETAACFEDRFDWRKVFVRICVWAYTQELHGAPGCLSNSDCVTTRILSHSQRQSINFARSVLL